MIKPINIKSGKIVGGDAVLNGIISGLSDGIHILHIVYAGKPKDIKGCRKYYFALCDILSYEGTTGYTTKEIHTVLKKFVLPLINEEYTSTRNLSLDEWYSYIKEIKKYIKENFEFYI